MIRAKNLAIALSVVAIIGVLGVRPVSAAPVQIYTATTTDLTNMTHQNAYAWQLNGISLGNYTITSAVMTFYNFANWTTAANDPYNILWVDLLDTTYQNAARLVTGSTNVYSVPDDTNTGTLGINDVLDGFRYSSGTNLSVVGSSNTADLLSSTTNHIYMGSSTNSNDSTVTGYNPAGGALGNNAGAFGTTPTTWSLTVTNATVLSALAGYITNGSNIALGLDSDCHFTDTSIQFQIFGTSNVTQSAVPEPATLALLGTGIVAVMRRRRAARRA